MTRQKLLVELGAAALPVLVPVPQVFGAWAPAVYQFPAVPVPGAFAAAGLVDAVLVSWNAVPRATYAIERAVDVAGAPGTWVEYTRTSDTAYAVPVAGGTLYWWRVRAVVFGRYSAYTAQIQRASVDGGSIAQQLSDLAADGKLTAGEKVQAKQRYNALTAKQGDLDAKATLYGITTEKTSYDNAITALKTYLKNTVGVLDASFVWTGITGTTAITRATWDSNWNTALVAEQALSNAIAAKAKTLADAAQSTADTARSEVPAGIPVGGTLFADIQINVLPDGTPNDGELRVGAGTDVVFIHPDGAVRTILAASSYCNTQFEGSAANKGWLAYVGTNTARFTPGLPWVVVRKVGDQWQYDDNTAWQNFTPSANDCIVAALQKDAADPGISRLQRLAARVHTYANGAWIDTLKPAEVGAEKTTGKPIDILVDGDVYGRPLKSRLNAGKPWIDFTEAIHTGKNVDNLADGTTYGRVKVGALTSGNVDLAKSGVVGRTLDNISDTVTYRKPGAGYVDASGRVTNLWDGSVLRSGSDIGTATSRAIAGLSSSGDVNRDVPVARVPALDFGTKITGRTADKITETESLRWAGQTPDNLVQTSNFEDGTIGTWTGGTIATYGSPVRNALNVRSDGSGIYYYANAGAYFPAEAGETFDLHADVLRTCQLRINFYDSTGAFIGSGTNVLNSGAGFATNIDIETVAPAGTWRARIAVRYPVELYAGETLSYGRGLIVRRRSRMGVRAGLGLESTGKVASGLNDVDRLIDGATYGRIKGTELTGGVHKLGVAGSGYKTADQRNLPNSLTTAFGAVRSTASLSANSAGTVSVNAHTVTRGPVTTSYSANAAAVTGLTQGTTYYIYTRDNNAGGSPTWLATTSVTTANGFDDAYVAGKITIPTSGTSGGGDGGACVQEDTWVLRVFDGRAVPTRARDVRVGDYLLLTDGTWGQVSRAEREWTQLVGVDFDGDGIDCSFAAPLELPDGSFLLAPDVAGLRLRGQDLDPLVHGVRARGMGWVIKITCENRSFWASRNGRRYVGHHNIKP